MRRLAFFSLVPLALAACAEDPAASLLSTPDAVEARASGAREAVDLTAWDANGNGIVCVKTVPASGKASSRAGERTIVKDDDGAGGCPGGFDAERIALAIDIAAGGSHACLLDAAGAAWCWGDNAHGQLGAAVGAQSWVPVAVVTNLRFTAIEAGFFHTCALGEDARVYCWGNNEVGQLGDGTTATRTQPAPVSGGQAYVALGAGHAYACALTPGEELHCWGGNGDGQLGRATATVCSGLFGTTPCGTTPAPVDTPLRFERASVGLSLTCGIATDGAAYCWGWDTFHQGGDGTAVTGPTPTPVASPPDLVTVAAGAITGCGLDHDGAAWCWGSHPFGTGYAGNGNLVGPNTPESVLGGHTFSWVAPSDGNTIFQFSCGIDTDGAAWCWGSNSLGQLGTDDPLPETCTVFGGPRSTDCVAEPVAVEGGLTWETLSLDREYACGLATGGVPYCWGANFLGNLGDGTTTSRSTPTPVAFP